MSSVFPLTNNSAIFELAKSKAKERAKTHWDNFMTNRLSACKWIEYNTELNTSWVDPWHENELFGIENDPATDYQITQNMYMLYCWFSAHGYCAESMAAIMTNAIHESTLTGGVWELTPAVTGHSPISKHPYSSLIGFDATSIIQNPNSYTWYTGGSAPAYAGNIITWTASFTDYEGTVWTLTANPGSWDACMRYPIKTELISIDGTIREMPVGYESGQLEFNRSVSRGDGRGYGLVQFTPWTKLPATCAHAYLADGKEDFNEANRHWQLNLTLILMLFEYQREIAMSGVPQTGNYFGQWVDSNAALQTSWGAFYQFPYNPSSTYNRRYFGQSITWDDFAAGTYLTWFESDIAAYISELEAQGATLPTQDDINWCRRQLAMTIWMACYIQTWYADDFGLRNISDYTLQAVNYWNNHGGYDIMDVPRARDIPNCELDQYHLTYKEFPALMATASNVSQRRKKNVRAVLLRHY